MAAQFATPNGQLAAGSSGNASGIIWDIGALVTHHHCEVYRYAYRLTGNQADAEDLTQEVFLVAQQRLHQLREPDKSLNWLFTILRNCYLKGRAKRRASAFGDLGLEDVDSLPERVSEDAIDRQQLQLAIDELPDGFKIVVMMYYFQECSYKQIASDLGISLGTVMSRLARAKGRLRKRLLRADSQALKVATQLGGNDNSERCV